MEFFWWGLLILFGIALVATLCGFKKYVYFLSIGYGFAVLACGIGIFVLALVRGWTSFGEPSFWILLAQTVLFVIYGIRLSGFLLVREIKNASYRKVLAEATGEGEKPMPVFVLVFMWIFTSVLYVAMDAPVYFRAINGSKDIVCPIVGIAISAIGIILEATADKQKSAQKKVRPDMVAKEGLYKLCRCPNYWGEITMWTGVFVAGITTYTGTLQWIVAIVAYICIVYIMFNGAQRLEGRQMKRYGDNPEYREYADKTPIILPFLPVYHLNKQK